MAGGGRAGEERILSIVLSTSELAKIDLSNIQLFQANEGHGHHGNGHNEGLYLNSEALVMADQSDPVVLKSRAVMEAENNRDDCFVGHSDESPDPPGCRTRRPPPMAGISRRKNHRAVPLPEPQQVAKPRIDLKSSPAAKFLAQLMPWDLQPSPLTPFTSAAVPFEWEEAPGRPKPRSPNRRSPRPLLHLPPRLLPRKEPRRVSEALNSSEDPDTPHRRSGSSGSVEEKRVISIEGVHKNPGCVLSCVDCDLPSPANSEHKASALITMWRKNSSSKHGRSNGSKSHKQKSLNPGGEFLIEKGNHELWVYEEAKSKEVNRYQSLNGMIAAAMGAQSEDLDFSKSTEGPYSKNLRPSPIMKPQFYCPKMPGRTKRKWVLRKLRRPARFFKSFFSAVWRSVCLRRSRHDSIGNIKHSYQSLSR